MRTLNAFLAFILAIGLGLAAEVRADAAVVLVAGTGSAPGSTTIYTCSQFPEFPPNCPSVTTPQNFQFFIPVIVDTDALATGPASFSGVQIGSFYFADFSIALAGMDQSGNNLFEGQNLLIQGTSNLHPCFNLVYPCTADRSTFSTPTFLVQQISPAPVPEPATWLTTLTGFISLGAWMRRRRRVVPFMEMRLYRCLSMHPRTWKQ